MIRAKIGATVIAIVFAGAPVVAATMGLSQYPTAEAQIKEYFRQNPGAAGPNCGTGQINDISNAEVLSDTPKQLIVRVDYSFSATALQNTSTCSGTQSSTVTFDKMNGGQLSVNKMDGMKP